MTRLVMDRFQRDGTNSPFVAVSSFTGSRRPSGSFRQVIGRSFARIR
jgi:hypothetical protein